MTLIRLIDYNGHPEYVMAEAIQGIYYHSGFKRVLVSLGGDSFHPAADKSVDQVKRDIDDAIREGDK